MGIRSTKRKPSPARCTAQAPKTAKPALGVLRTPKPGPRGLRGPGRGRVSYVEAPPEWRGTTVQVCGLFPFAVGGGSPTIGVPLGRNLLTGATVCCDPLAWFQRAKLILNPSMFLLGLPALGKSTLVRRMVIGLAGSGTVPLVLGDLKPDYVDTVHALGGQVLRLGRGDLHAYRAVVDPLQRSLLSLLDGPLGSVFAKPTTQRIRLDATAVCVDVSGISVNDTALQAAVLLACWAEGFGAVEAANALADAGLAPQRRFFIVLDELWRVLRSGEGMVDKVDELTRLNRSSGVGQAMITHSMADLRALRNVEDRDKAKGFIERAGLVVCGGLPAQEVAELSEIVAFSRAERAQVTSWSTPPGWDVAALPPGVGKFLIKSGQRPGIPVSVDLTRAELDAAVHDTNKRWAVPPQAAPHGPGGAR